MDIINVKGTDIQMQHEHVTCYIHILLLYSTLTYLCLFIFDIQRGVVDSDVTTLFFAPLISLPIISSQPGDQMLVMWKRAVISDAKVTTVGVYEQYPAPPSPLPFPTPLPLQPPPPPPHILHCLSPKLIVLSVPIPLCYSGNREIWNAKCSDCYRIEREEFKKQRERNPKKQNLDTTHGRNPPYILGSP